SQASPGNAERVTAPCTVRVILTTPSKQRCHADAGGISVSDQDRLDNGCATRRRARPRGWSVPSSALRISRQPPPPSFAWFGPGGRSHRAGQSGMQSRFPRLVSDAADANGRTGVLRSKVLEDAERVADAAQVRAITVLHHADFVTLAVIVRLTPV